MSWNLQCRQSVLCLWTLESSQYREQSSQGGAGGELHCFCPAGSWELSNESWGMPKLACKQVSDKKKPTRLFQRKQEQMQIDRWKICFQHLRGSNTLNLNMCVSILTSMTRKTELGVSWKRREPESVKKKSCVIVRQLGVFKPEATGQNPKEIRSGFIGWQLWSFLLHGVLSCFDDTE